MRSELSVAVGMIGPLMRLAVGLQAEPQPPQLPAHRALVHVEPLLAQRRGQALATLRLVHRSGDSGSPRVAPSKSANNASRSPGSRSSIDGRPAPGRRTRPSGARCAAI